MVAHKCTLLRNTGQHAPTRSGHSRAESSCSSVESGRSNRKQHSLAALRSTAASPDALQPLTAILWTFSALLRPLSALLRPLSDLNVLQQFTALLRPLSDLLRPLSAVHVQQPLSELPRPLSALLRPLSAQLGSLSARLRPLLVCVRQCSTAECTYGPP